MYVCMYVCMYVYMYVCMYVYTYISISLSHYIYIYIYHIHTFYYIDASGGERGGAPATAEQQTMAETINEQEEQPLIANTQARSSEAPSDKRSQASVR